MKKNMGNADRITRLLLAAAITILFFTNIITGTVGTFGTCSNFCSY